MNISTDELLDEEEDFLFDAEDEATETEVDENASPWRLLVVDDDQSVHDVTVMLLKDFRYRGRPLEILHAFSGAEARDMVDKSEELALILMDVVMETDSAGLDAVRYIRQHPKNKLVQIVVRTGQPGASSEDKVISDFEVDDYQDKTELSAGRLKAVVESALGFYADLFEPSYDLDTLNIDLS